MKETRTLTNEALAAAQLPDYGAEIIRILRSNLAPKQKREQVLEYHENDIAAVLPLLSREERARAWTILGTETAADILEYAEERGDYLEEMGIRKRAEILSALNSAEAVEYLQTLEKPDRSALLELMDEEARQDVLLLSSFDEDEIGSWMTTEYVSVPVSAGVRAGGSGGRARQHLHDLRRGRGRDLSRRDSAAGSHHRAGRHGAERHHDDLLSLCVRLRAD